MFEGENSKRLRLFHSACRAVALAQAGHSKLEFVRHSDGLAVASFGFRYSNFEIAGHALSFRAECNAALEARMADVVV
jgi:hypothetical protein